MKIYLSIFWLNILFFLLVIAAIVYAKLFGPSVAALFLPPFFSQFFVAGLLTRTFQILCSIPPIVCAFSFGLLTAIRPRSKDNAFILYSALVTLGFFLLEIFRIHIYLYLAFRIPKYLLKLIFMMAFLSYGLAFWRQIKSTPYVLLLTSVGLLFIAITVESLSLSGHGTPSLLEGIPKLFSQVNISFYFWYICHREVVRSLKLSIHSDS